MAVQSLNNDIIKIDELCKGEILKNGRYEILDKISNGNYGDSYLVYKNEKKQEKCILKIFKNTSFFNEIISEIEKIKENNNEFIVKYIDYFLKADSHGIIRPYLISEFYEDGDLDQLIKKKKKENSKMQLMQIFDWSSQIISGLDYLHKMNIVHGNIKPENIFINKDSVVIGHVGLTKNAYIVQNLNDSTNEINYFSPELIQKGDVNCKTDIWSFGCVLYELFELKKAFNEKSTVLTMNAIIKYPTPEIKVTCINTILKKCFERDTDKRGSAEDIFKLVDDAKQSPKRKINSPTENKSKKPRLAKPKGYIKINKEVKKLSIYCKNLKNEDVKEIKEFKQKFLDLKKEVKIEDLKNKEDYLKLMETLANFEEQVFQNNNEYMNLQIEILELKRTYLPGDHLSLIDSLNNLGSIYDNLDDKNRAKIYYENSLELIKKNHIDYHPSAAKTMNNLGLIYYDLGDKVKAKECYENALKIKIDILPKKHISLADTIHNLGLVYSDLGDRDKAIDYLQNSLEIKVNSLCKNHTSIATSLAGLGFVYFDSGEKKAAIGCFEKALEIYRKNLPENHSLIADTLTNLGVFCSSSGDKYTAIKYFESGLEIKQRILPKNHHSLAITMNNLGLAYYDLGNFKKAIEYLKSSLDIKNNALALNDLSIADTLKNLGDAYFGLTYKKKSLYNYNSSLEIYEKMLPPGHSIINKLKNKIKIASYLLDVKIELEKN